LPGLAVFRPRLSSGLTTFFPFRWHDPEELFTDRETADWVVRELLKQNIQVRSIGFDNSGSATGSPEKVYAIRVSTGYFNTAAQVETFQAGLRGVLERVPS